jgi:hypothetical protein
MSVTPHPYPKCFVGSSLDVCESYPPALSSEVREISQCSESVILRNRRAGKQSFSSIANYEFDSKAEEFLERVLMALTRYGVHYNTSLCSLEQDRLRYAIQTCDEEICFFFKDLIARLPLDRHVDGLVLLNALFPGRHDSHSVDRDASQLMRKRTREQAFLEDNEPTTRESSMSDTCSLSTTRKTKMKRHREKYRRYELENVIMLR